MDLEKIETLLKLLKDNEVGSFTYEDETLSMQVDMVGEQPQYVAAPAVAVAAAPVAAVSAAAAGPAEDLESDPSLATVESPMVGTFYRAPSPESPAFVEVGAKVSKGQTLCIIEAMKLMNEIESEVDGIVTAILVDNAQAVQFGQAMFKIKAG